MEHPASRTKAAKAGLVVLFARNELCALAATGSRSPLRRSSRLCSIL
jgi:hypothetical protein